jgi:hypothetical protein
MRQVIDEAPDLAAAIKLNGLIQAQLQAYDQLMDEHELSQESQNRLLKMVAKHSDH